ncbi:polysaccharide biosynthesis C-terminal domain-containing protein [Crateriforma spongiae]|uniref:polysaccharide biosynthesis C-terminal domain-containing protein n=1 Tax=Crateriforma spongiae TaxID=2724528 RepID=UPI0039AF3F52
MKRGTVSRNAIAAVLQVCIRGAVLLIVYRTLLQTAGPEKLGVWSLVLATASASKISEMGFATGSVKFVAEAYSDKDSLGVSRVIQTATISVAAFLAAFLLIAFPIIYLWINWIVPHPHISLSQELLPYAFASVLLGGIGGVISGCIDGIHRADIRAGINSLASIIYLVCIIAFVPRMGLVGAAVAQVIQSLAIVLAGWAYLSRTVRHLPLLPIIWRYSLFRRMLNYGIGFQAISISSAMFDPIVKSLIGNFGGMSATAYFEMANRMIQQVRSLIVAANRVLIPRIAELNKTKADQLAALYARNYKVVFAISIVVFCGLIASIPTISLLWIGEVQPTFIAFSATLTIGNLINTLSGPAYFSNLGTGHLRSNIVSHLCVTLTTLVVGTILGNLYGANGVVLAATIGLAAGSLFVVAAHLKRTSRSWASALPTGLRLTATLLIFASIGLTALQASSGYTYRLTLYASPAVYLCIATGCVMLTEMPSELLARFRGIRT